MNFEKRFVQLQMVHNISTAVTSSWPWWTIGRWLVDNNKVTDHYKDIRKAKSATASDD